MKLIRGCLGDRPKAGKWRNQGGLGWNKCEEAGGKAIKRASHIYAGFWAVCLSEPCT